MKKIVNLGLAGLIILAFVYGIYQKEQIIKDGRIVYLKLAPVDPRSIMQGDYMRLRYEIETFNTTNSGMARSGFAYLKTDNKNVVIAANYVIENLAIGEDEIRFKFTSNGNRVDIQPSSFLFQQGLRSTYAAAKYGIFRVSGDEHLLVGLADGDLNEIKPPKADNKSN